MTLDASLSIAVQSLLADTGALQATNNNIANANTPGYTRQNVVLQSAAPSKDGSISIGNGVVLQGFQSVRSELLQMRIQQETGEQSEANARLGSLQQIQPLFTTSSQDVGTQMTALFTSLSSLSTDPTDQSLRQGVMSAAQNLVSAFHSVSNSLTSIQSGLNTQVTQDVGQINQLTQQIAALNPQIAALTANGQDGGTLQDQQDQLILSLSALTNVTVTKTDDGDTISTGSGATLVVGAQSYRLQTATGSDGMQHVIDQVGTDVTSSLTGGDLGGTIQTRDEVIPGLSSSLDSLASQIGTAFNAAQAAGFDQAGHAGTNLFQLPTTTVGAASSISLATTDPAAIAASSDGSAGSNGNLAKFSAIETTALSNGETPPGMYAGLVFQVGSLTSNANAESSATAASLLQLNDQKSSVSGVSIDEESTNLIRYQQAYEAAARVITTIDSLFDVTMSMGTSAAS